MLKLVYIDLFCGYIDLFCGYIDLFVVFSKSGAQDAHLVVIQDADAFLTMLNDLSAMGAAMRRVMTSALTNPSVR